ncbi:MAG: DUF2213 domain-containing protein [Pseudomonadota bacterium]
MTDFRFADRIGELTGVQRHPDGFLAATVKAARTGIQVYAGDEVGKPEMKVVRVYRPEGEVMSRDSMGTFKGKAVTDGHPNERVTADNDKKYRGGTIMGVARDGETVATDVIITDATLAKKIEDGNARQLSAGYTARLEWKAGKTPAGEQYDAVQRDIYVDHLAVVVEARGGDELRIGDDAENGVIYPINRAVTKETKMSDAQKTVVVDGRSVVTDAAGEILIQGLLDEKASLTGQVSELETKVSDQAKEIETKDGEIESLKTSLEESKLSAKDLNALVASRDATMKKAKEMGMSEKDMEDMDEGEMKKSAVKKKMGDSADVDAWSDERIAGFFDAHTVTDVKPKAPGKDALRDGINPGKKSVFGDSVMKAAGVKLKKEEA